MIEVNGHPERGVLALKVSGTLTEEELDELPPIFGATHLFVR